MGLFSDIENPPEPFWSRRTIAFAASGLACYALSRWLFTFDSTAVLLLTSIFRLTPLLAFVRSKQAWPIALAVPYPFELIFAAYAARGRLLSEDLSLTISNPTAFLMILGGGLLVSIPVTGWLVAHAVSLPVTGQLRTLAGWLFGITALAIAASVPQWSVFLMHNIAEPAALAGFAAVLGFGTRVSPEKR